jgi:O-antigen biosynthesis protein
MDLSIVIVNWNAKEFLKDCLDSINNSETKYISEVFVVDNNSTDDSVNFLKKHYPEVKLIINDYNAGFPKANNQAINLANGKYILLLNPDTIISKDTIQVMIDFMEENNNCGVSGCKVQNPDGTLQLACRRNIPTPMDALYKMLGLSKLFPNVSVFNRYNLSSDTVHLVTEVDAVSGAFLLIRKEVVDKIGGLDEVFFMHGEDLDWCLRSKLAGYTNYYVPFTSIIHYHGQSSKKRLIKTTINFHQSMYLFYRKHYSNSFIKPIVYLGIFVRLIFSLLKVNITKRVN